MKALFEFEVAFAIGSRLGWFVLLPVCTLELFIVAGGWIVESVRDAGLFEVGYVSSGRTRTSI